MKWQCPNGGAYVMRLLGSILFRACRRVATAACTIASPKPTSRRAMPVAPRWTACFETSTKATSRLSGFVSSDQSLPLRAIRAACPTAEDQSLELKTRALDAEIQSCGSGVASTGCPTGGPMISPTMREGEIRSLAEIGAASIAKPAAVTRDVHDAVSERIFGALGPFGAPVRQIHDGISKAAYRGINAALGAPVAAAGRGLARAAAGSASVPLVIPTSPSSSASAATDARSRPTRQV
jgi:hypothetical protein